MAEEDKVEVQEPVGEVEETAHVEEELSTQDVLEKELEQQKENTKKEKDNALLHMAELENFKRRKNQEVESFKKLVNSAKVA